MSSYYGTKTIFITVFLGLINSANAQASFKKLEKSTKPSNIENSQLSTSKVVAAENSTTKSANDHINSLNFHFENERLPSEVNTKMNFNKSHQRPLSDGILKSYKVQMKSCNSEESTKNAFSFLNNTKGFVKADFLSSGLVNLIVAPEYNSVDLKDMMLSKGMAFNFISESYFLK